MWLLQHSQMLWEAEQWKARHLLTNGWMFLFCSYSHDAVINLIFFISQNNEKERRRFLVKGTIIGNPWTLLIYCSKSLSNISDVSLVDGIQKYGGIRKVIYIMNKISAVMRLLWSLYTFSWCVHTTCNFSLWTFCCHIS